VALLDNAVKYTDENGSIELSLRKGEGKILVGVKNDATVSDEEVKHLFERFYKADRSHSGNGTGLGLAIASETMARMGERIWVENGEGKIEFIFTLERAEK